MQDALGIVVVAVVVAAALVGVATVLVSRTPHDRIGRSPMTFDREAPGADAGWARAEEIAQMLAASNARRAARGRPPLALSDFADPGLEAEVRAAVEAGNARLVARGKAPLDDEAAECILLGDDPAIDEHKRDELVEAFETRRARSTAREDPDEDEVDEEDELEPDPDEF